MLPGERLLHRQVEHLDVVVELLLGEGVQLGGVGGRPAIGAFEGAAEAGGDLHLQAGAALERGHLDVVVVELLLGEGVQLGGIGGRPAVGALEGAAEAGGDLHLQAGAALERGHRVTISAGDHRRQFAG